MATIFDTLRGRDPGKEDEIKRRADEARRKYEASTGEEAPVEQGLEEGDLSDYSPAGIGRNMLKKGGGLLRKMAGKTPPPKSASGVIERTGKLGQTVETYKDVAKKADVVDGKVLPHSELADVQEYMSPAKQKALREAAREAGAGTKDKYGNTWDYRYIDGKPVRFKNGVRVKE